MSVLSRQTYRQIEYHLHTYEDKKLRIEEWRTKTIYPARKREQFGNNGYYSNPTAGIALRLCTPPKHILNDMKWVEVIDGVHAKFKGTDRERLFDVWYGKPTQNPDEAAKKVPIGRRAFFRYRQEVVIYTAIAAAQYGLLTL